MKTLFFYSFLLHVIFFFTGRSNLNTTDKEEGARIDFGKLKTVNTADLISDYFYVALESSEASLLGNIDQIEVYNDRIYILDSSKTNALYVFTKEGKFAMKLEGKGDGPGEFISPHSFWIDRGGYIFILDRQLDRLQKYRLSDLEFVEDVVLPSPAPTSFALLPNSNHYIYYYSLRQHDAFSGKQFVIADGVGNVVSSFYDAPPTAKILHGTPANFYLFNGQVRTYPHFSNKVYELADDSLKCCYTFSWENQGFPPTELFQKYKSSGEVMKEILTGTHDWIRLLYVYELPDMLAVKYYVKRDLYLSIADKDNNKFINIKNEQIVDDLGIGGKFPLPLTVCDDRFVGAINSFDIDRNKVKDKRLLDLLDNMSDEGNPILIFYSIDWV